MRQKNVPFSKRNTFSEIIRVDVLSMYQFSKSATPVRNLPRINVDEVLLFPFPFPTGISRVLCHYFHSSQIYIGGGSCPVCMPRELMLMMITTVGTLHTGSEGKLSFQFFT